MSNTNAHRRTGHSIRRVAALLIFFAASTSIAMFAVQVNDSPKPPSLDASADETLLLDVEVNGRSIGMIGEFVLRQGRLMARLGELRDLGIKVAGVNPAQSDMLVDLSGLPGLRWNIDLQRQIVHITVAETQLIPAMLRPDTQLLPEEHRVIESGTGATLNYDIVDTIAGGGNGASGVLDWRAFSAKGIISSNWLGYAGATAGPAGKNSAIRLDSVYTIADVNSLRRYSLGDYITSGLSWARPVHVFGIQVRSDFSSRPDLVTLPLPSLAGSAAVPSTVDVFADGNLVLSNQVVPGPFEIPQIPVMSGAGTISMTVVNALGEPVTLTRPFYASTALLAKNLQTFAAQAGLVRRNWGSASYDYGKLAAMGSYRRGLSQSFTLEGSAEDTPGALMGGIGSVVQVANFGVLNLAVGGSFGSAGPGMLICAGAQRIARRLSAGAQATIANREFRDVATMNGSPTPRKQLSGFASVALRHLGTAGMAYAGVDEDATPRPITTFPGQPVHSHVLTGNYSLQLHHIAVYASGFRSFDDAGSSGVQFGVTIPTGRRSSIDVSVTTDGNTQIEAQKSALRVHDWGYQAYFSTGQSLHEFGELQYKSRAGIFSGGVDSSSGTTTARMESQGAFSLVDRRVFLSNTIFDSFAVVDTSPLPRVHVLQENRDVGRTNGSGRLLVPDMRAFELNHITIVATELPADVTANSVSRELRPQDRSGVVVRFPLKFSHAALLRLVDESGKAIPVGSIARVRSDAAPVPIGYDGEAYVEDLDIRNELKIELADGRRCTVAFEYHPAAGDIPLIGPLRCVERKP